MRATPSGASPASPASRARASEKPPQPKPDPVILFQKYFKSLGPRTYATQLKQAANGNHFLVITEGKRDDKTGLIRKSQLYIFAEDFPAFFRLLHETAQFIKSNPVPPEVRKRREAYWVKQRNAQVEQSQCMVWMGTGSAGLSRPTLRRHSEAAEKDAHVG